MYVLINTYYSDGSLSVEEGCQILVQNNISSAPVYDGKKGHYTGMFDYGDVIAYILLVLHRKPGQRGNDDIIDPESFEIKSIVKTALSGQKVPVKLASGNSLFFFYFVLFVYFFHYKQG
jgi:hypothetical protein